MKVLILASSFSPDAVVAAHRFSNIVSKMPEFGIDPIVIATKKRKALGIDNTLPVISTPVYRTPMIPPWPYVPASIPSKLFYKLWRYISPIDNAIGWAPSTIIKGIKLVNEKSINTIIATCPPRSALLAAYVIAVLTDTKLVLDYRDPWTGYEWKSKKKGNDPLYSNLEEKIVNHASLVVVCTEYMKNSLQQLLRISPGKIKVIPNGFNPGKVSPIPPETNSINITYAGSLYGDRNIRMLLNSIRRLLQEYDDTLNIKVHIYGNPIEEDIEAFKNAQLDSMLFFHKPLNHKEVLRRMAGSDVLFLPSGEDVKYALPYKLFDYLKANKPVLAVAPIDSALHHFMNKHKVGEYAELNNPDSIYRALVEIVINQADFSAGCLNSFHWEHITDIYCKNIKCYTNT